MAQLFGGSGGQLHAVGEQERPMKLLLKACLSVAITLALGRACFAQDDKQPDHKSKPLAKWIEALKDDDFEVRYHARKALGPDGPYSKLAVAAIIDAFKDEKPPVLEDAAEALGTYGPPVVSILLRELKNSNALVRATASRALGIIRPKQPEAVPALVAALKDPSPEVREAAGWGLGRLGKTAHEAVPSLAIALQDKHDSVRQAAASALFRMERRAKPAIPALIVALKDKDRTVRHSVAQTLWKIGPDAKAAVPALIDGLQDKQVADWDFAQALGGIGPAAKEAVPALIKALDGHDDNLLQRWAAIALGEIGPDAKAAVPALLQALKDKDYPERDSVIYALGQIGPQAKAAVPTLIGLMNVRDPLGNECTIARALGAIGPDAKAAIPELTTIVRNQLAYSSAREAAAKAVMKIDPELAAKEGMETAYLAIRLGKIPAIKPAPRPALTEEQRKKIKDLIAKLADIEHPDFGMAATLTGHAFAPLPDQTHMSVGLLMDHGVKSSKTFRKLVEFGPDALPILLDALEDKTPTKLKVDCSFAMMKGFGSDLYGNPLNRLEQRVFDNRLADDDDDFDEVPDSYTVKVGDVCFVAIGQIVGREYLALSYVPTGIVVVKSPVQTKELRDRVRALWSSKDPAKTLMDSLLIDYATEGIFNGKSLDGWYEGSDFQIQAAMRLLYYFPKETEPLITTRLRSLNVRAAKNSDGWMRNEVKNGVRTIDFIQAVSWCQLPAIQEAFADIARRTDDPDIKAAATAQKAKTGDKP